MHRVSVSLSLRNSNLRYGKNDTFLQSSIEVIFIIPITRLQKKMFARRFTTLCSIATVLLSIALACGFCDSLMLKLKLKKGGAIFAGYWGFARLQNMLNQHNQLNPAICGRGQIINPNTGRPTGLGPLGSTVRVLEQDGTLAYHAVQRAIGNFYDRLTYNAVPDFIDLHYNGFHWFTFNVADIFITLGIIAYIMQNYLVKMRDEI